MRAPGEPARRGLWAALNVAQATPSGGDFTEERLRDIDAAIAWLQREDRRPRIRSQRAEAALQQAISLGLRRKEDAS